jgi:hypothetical protein
MSCTSCRSEQHVEFGAEMMIHFTGPESLDQPGVLAFPSLLVCMDCGRTEFIIPETALAELANGIRKSEPKGSGTLPKRSHSVTQIVLESRCPWSPSGGPR